MPAWQDFFSFVQKPQTMKSFLPTVLRKVVQTEQPQEHLCRLGANLRITDHGIGVPDLSEKMFRAQSWFPRPQSTIL